MRHCCNQARDAEIGADVYQQQPQRNGNSQLEAVPAGITRSSPCGQSLKEERPKWPMQAAVLHFNIINNRPQASLPHFSAVSCILLTVIFLVISPAIELPKNLILCAEKASPFCWGKNKRDDLFCFPSQEPRGWGQGGRRSVWLWTHQVCCGARHSHARQNGKQCPAPLKVGRACFAGRLQPEVTGLSYERGI